MDLYPLLRPLLFRLDAETAHQFTLNALDIIAQLRLTGLLDINPKTSPVKVMGLEFKNPLGLAAGLDKNGEHIDALAALGFGFVEIGTVTPRPQPGNPKPRLFRIPEHQAIINRMGFNNLGIEHLLECVKRARRDVVLGINIGKNFDTPLAEASDDYLLGLRKAYPYADYVAINISSPNTQNLRQLQQGDELRRLIAALKEAQLQLQQEHGRYVPLALKIAPDLEAAEIGHIAQLLLEFGVDAVIATNTTVARDMLHGHPMANESGGLSGAPVKALATQVVKLLAGELQGRIPIIAAGGILCASDAQEKFAAGASLVQIYSGLIYRGPRLVGEILETL